MIATSTLVDEYGTYTRNTSAENMAKGKIRMQFYYETILRGADNYIIEKTKYGRTLASQRSYLLPPDVIHPMYIRVKIGNTWQRVRECPSVQAWLDLTDTVRRSPYPDWYMVFNEQGNLHVEFDPVPTETISADDPPNIELICQAAQDPLYFPIDYATGNATVSQGSAVVTFSGSTLTDSMVGRFIKFTGGKYWYEIKEVDTGESTATLVNYVQEQDFSNIGFTISEMQRSPEEFHYTPLWGAVMDYWLLTDIDKSKEFEKKYARDTLFLQKKYQNKTRSQVTPGIKVGSRILRVPLNYPRNLIG